MRQSWDKTGGARRGRVVLGQSRRPPKAGRGTKERSLLRERRMLLEWCKVLGHRLLRRIGRERLLQLRLRRERVQRSWLLLSDKLGLELLLWGLSPGVRRAVRRGRNMR